MPARLITYLLPRLILGMIITLFVGFGALYIYNEILFSGSGGAAPLLFYAAGLLAFVAGWKIWTLGGRLQLNNLLARAEISSESNEYYSARNNFLRARKILLHSSHFIPGKKGKDYGHFIQRFADFCSSAGLKDEQALAAYLDYLEYNPQDEAFARRILPLVVTSDEASAEHLPLLQRLWDLAPESPEIADSLTLTYLKYEIFNSTALEALLSSIRNYSSFRLQSLKFLLPRMLEQERTDPLAQEVYLESFKSGLEHRDLKPMLSRLADRADFEGAGSPFIREITRLLTELPQQEREALLNRARDERISHIPLTPARPAEPENEPTLKIEPELQALFDEDEQQVFKPGSAEILVEKTTESLKNSFSLLTTGFSGIWRLGKNALNLVGKRWDILKWVIAGILSLVIITAVIKTVVIHRKQPPVVSLEVLSDKPYTIQLAAFKDRQRAEKFLRDLKIPNLRPYLVSSRGEIPWHQVRLGHYDSTEEAKKAAAELGLKDYFIANFSPGTYLE